MSTRSREIYVTDRTMWCLMRLQAAKRTVDDTVTTDSIAEAILADHLLANYPSLGEAYDSMEKAKKAAESAVLEKMANRKELEQLSEAKSI